MAAGASVQTPKKQQGLALLVVVIAIILAASSYFISGLSIIQVKADRIKETGIALKKAKKALIAYAVNYPEITGANRGPGYLPCPDLINNGISLVNNCKTGGVPNVGRLPWVTLGVGDLRDRANERLWYAVSENFDYSNSPTVNKINTATIGTITLKNNNNNVIYDGTALDAIVAVVIAPSEALTRDDGAVQVRSAANVNAVVNYLDVHVASAEDNATFQDSTLNGFIEGEITDGAGNVIVNDQFVVITYGEIMEQVHKRVSREIRNLINEYFLACGAYPEASVFDPTKASFDSAGQGSSLELREGHLPLNSALPVNWGDVCSQPLAPTPVVNAPVPPLWLAAEDWHKVTYYEFSYTNPLFPILDFPAPIPVGVACTQGVDCLSVNGTDVPIDNKEALIVFAGRDITAGPNRPSAQTSDYFEGDNDDSNVALDELIYDATQAEDYIWVIAP